MKMYIFMFMVAVFFLLLFLFPRRPRSKYRVTFERDYGYLPQVRIDGAWQMITRDGKASADFIYRKEDNFRGLYHADLSSARTCVEAYKGLSVVPLVVWTSEETNKGGW